MLRKNIVVKLDVLRMDLRCAFLIYKSLKLAPEWCYHKVFDLSLITLSLKYGGYHFQ